MQPARVGQDDRNGVPGGDHEVRQRHVRAERVIGQGDVYAVAQQAGRDEAEQRFVARLPVAGVEIGEGGPPRRRAGEELEDLARMRAVGDVGGSQGCGVAFLLLGLKQRGEAWAKLAG
jgi:hypothetical protein